MVTATNNRNNSKKEDIARNIFLNIGIPLSYSTKIVTDLINIITTSLLLNKKIKIKNFGVFTLHKKKIRTGRNPKNKKEYKILPRTVATFKASKKLKSKINNYV